jgi:uncharacterized membrane protein
MDTFAIDVISIIGITFYFVMSFFMAYAIIADVRYKGNSYVDCMFINIWLFFFGFVVWPILVVIVYSLKLHTLFVKELKHTWYS